VGGLNGPAWAIEWVLKVLGGAHCRSNTGCFVVLYGHVQHVQWRGCSNARRRKRWAVVAAPRLACCSGFVEDWPMHEECALGTDQKRTEHRKPVQRQRRG
jgi:hypothetical protein